MKKLLKLVLFTFLGMIIFTPGLLFAQETDVPKQLAFQGRLLDSTEVPVNGTVNFTFRIKSGSTIVWQKDYNNQAVTKGIYNVTLSGGGSIGNLDTVDFNRPLTIDVLVNNAPVSENVPLTSSPYALAVKDGIISEKKLQNDAVTEVKIKEGAVTNNKIGVGAITQDKIQNGAVTTDKIADASINSSKFAPGVSIGSATYADTAGNLVTNANVNINSLRAATQITAAQGFRIGDGQSIQSATQTNAFNIGSPVNTQSVNATGSITASQGFIIGNNQTITSQTPASGFSIASPVSVTAGNTFSALGGITVGNSQIIQSVTQTTPLTFNSPVTVNAGNVLRANGGIIIGDGQNFQSATQTSNISVNSPLLLNNTASIRFNGGAPFIQYSTENSGSVKITGNLTVSGTINGAVIGGSQDNASFKTLTLENGANSLTFKKANNSDNATGVVTLEGSTASSYFKFNRPIRIEPVAGSSGNSLFRALDMYGDIAMTTGTKIILSGTGTDNGYLYFGNTANPISMRYYADVDPSPATNAGIQIAANSGNANLGVTGTIFAANLNATTSVTTAQLNATASVTTAQLDATNATITNLQATNLSLSGGGVTIDCSVSGSVNVRDAVVVTSVSGNTITVARAATEADNKIIGVVSETSGQTCKVVIAGVTTVSVSESVSAGQLLIASGSGNAGKVKSSSAPENNIGSILGKAIASSSGGTVAVLVNIQ